MPNESKLERCPFCGAENPQIEQFVESFFVVCKNESCQIRTSLQSKEGAIENWNTRQPPVESLKSRCCNAPPKFDSTGHSSCSKCGQLFVYNDELTRRRNNPRHMKNTTDSQTATAPAVACSDGLGRHWLPIEDAPHDGSSIIGLYDDGDEAAIMWSDRPVCMLGSRCGGYPAGWATDGTDTDYNLPMDTPKAWRPSESPSLHVESKGIEEIAEKLALARFPIHIMPEVELLQKFNREFISKRYLQALTEATQSLQDKVIELADDLIKEGVKIGSQAAEITQLKIHLAGANKGARINAHVNKLVTERNIALQSEIEKLKQEVIEWCDDRQKVNADLHADIERKDEALKESDEFIRFLAIHHNSLSEGQRRDLVRISDNNQKSLAPNTKNEAVKKHCPDCCCGHAWKALGIIEYTGKSIPEHIKLLKADLDIAIALLKQAQETIQGVEIYKQHSGKNYRREWVDVGAWLYQNDVVAILDNKKREEILTAIQQFTKNKSD